MKKVYLVISICLFGFCPSFADIAKNNNEPICNESTIGVRNGSTNLEAQWTANTINLDYYAGDTKVSTGSCQYDGGITLPSDPTPPTGYVFSGWKAKTIGGILSSFGASANGSLSYSKGPEYCHKTDPSGGRSYSDCPLQEFNELAMDEWTVVFDYGTVKGAGKCSGKSGASYDTDASNWTADTNALNNASGEKTKCWCKILAFSEQSDSNYQSAESLWVYVADYVNQGGVTVCTRGCSGNCAHFVKDYYDYRQVIYSQVK